MRRTFLSFIIAILALIALFFYSATTGSIEVTSVELIKGLFTGDIENVEIVKDLRFPRIIVSLVAGAALAVSGVLLQAVMRNPLAEPGIIRSEEHTSELQSRGHIVCRLLLEKKNTNLNI